MRRTASTTLLALFGALALVGCRHQVSEPLEDDTHAEERAFAGDELGESFVDADDDLVSPALETSGGANRVAVMLDVAEGHAHPTLRARGVDGTVFGPWVDVEWTFDELGALAGRAVLDDVWLAVQVAVPKSEQEAVAHLTYAAAFVDDVAAPEVDLEESESGAELSAALAFVGVQPRSAWGARNHTCSTTDASRYRMALHHTAAKAISNVELAMRQAQAYHMDGRGYCDIAYHFGVSQDGRVFELRPLPYRGGHTLNNNTGNVGIVFLGCFDGACGNDQPTEALLNAGAGIVRMMHLTEGIEINADRVRGHRDHAGAQTACPGGTLYPRLEEIRQRARDMGNTPAEPPPPAPTGCGVLTSGAQLLKGQSMTSCDGRFVLAHQGDGNVVLYHGSTALWSTGTHGTNTGTFAMQGDGNLVLYTAWGSAIFATGTHGKTNAYLRVQDDGNLVVYQGSAALWSTGTFVAAPPPPPPPPPAGCGVANGGTSFAPGQGVTSCDGRFTFVHQGDGNVVLYKQGAPLWSTGTHGTSTSTLAMQGDGNLVLYRTNGSARWSTGTHGNNGARLAVQDDGNVVVYRSNGTAIWSTGTHGH